jgi:hypothetical protein
MVDILSATSLERHEIAFEVVQVVDVTKMKLYRKQAGEALVNPYVLMSYIVHIVNPPVLHRAQELLRISMHNNLKFITV